LFGNLFEIKSVFRRKMNEADNKQRARGVDSLLNAETVKYFSMEAWEVDKYKEAVLDYQGLKNKTFSSCSSKDLELCILDGMA
jgi:ATP-binding cassette subfamily B (MDR/TAP) protein 7